MSDIKELIASKLRPIGNAIREKNGSTELIPIDDMPQAIRDIQGGGGGIVEVTELPSVGKANTVYKLIHKNVGTEVPTTGLIENVYLNTSLSIDEVNAILKTIEYIPATNEGEPDIYIVFETLDSIVRIFDYNNGSYAIMVGMNVAYVSDESFVSAGATFVGWNPDLTNPCVVYQESTPTDDFVSQNDKLTSLFSVTPFEEEKIPSEMYYLFENSEWQQISGGILEVNNLPTSGEDNYVYKLSQQPTYEIYVNIEGQGVLKLKDIAQQEGAHIELVEVVNSKEKLPSNPIEFTGMEQISVYYVRNDDLYVYGAFGENDTKIWFSFSTLMEMSFSGEVASTDDMTVVNTMYVLSIPNDGYDYYIYEKGESTQVPNSGLIENLYFNTKLSVEEVDNILNQLTYDYDGYAYVVGAYEKGNGYGNIIIVEANAFTQGQITSGYIIGHMHDTTDMTKTEFIYMSNQGLVDLALTLGINTKVGWNMETLNLNQTFIGHYGTENDKLINVVSTTPYPHWTEISGGATVKATPIAVPNTGYVERVYLNKSLSFDEVNALVEKANSFVANEIVPIYCVVSNDTFDKQLSTFKLTDHDGTTFNSIHYPNLGNVIWSERDYYNEEKDGSITQFKKGWMFEEDYVEINSEVVSFIEGDFAVNVGQHNDKLTELFSINNVFETNEIELSGDYDGNPLVLSNKYVKKTVVPNEGYVERVYFNTSLSIDEVKAILEKFHTCVDVDTLDNAMWLINIDDFDNPSVAPEKLYWIMPSRDTGDYAILSALAQVIFKSDSSKWAGGDFVGWNPEFITAEKPYLEINSQVFPIVTENGNETKIGGFNDKIVDLFSLTPFEEKIYDSVEVDIKEMLEEKKLPLSVTVNVESQEPNLQEKEITENGEYVADEGYDGFSKVTVNVGGSSEDRLKKLLDTKQSAMYLFSSYQGKSVDDLIKYDDTENVTNMRSMFEQCTALTTIPQLDTSNVTNMRSMFEYCTALTTIPQLDTSNVTNMQNMFNNCWVLTEIPQLDTSNVTSMSNMFNCGGSGDGNKYLKTIPQLNTSKVSNMDSMFYNCQALETIQQLNLIKVTNASNVSDLFCKCKALTNLTLLNIKVNLTIGSGDGTRYWDYGHLLTLESLINTVKEFINIGSARILTMGTANLEKIASTYVKFTDSSVTSIPTNEKGDVVVCESTDTGAMLLKDYALLKNWTLA